MHSADEDNTLTIGSNNKNNIVPANEFKSITYGDSTYLRLKGVATSVNASASPSSGTGSLTTDLTGAVTGAPVSGVLYNAGTIPTLSTTDFDGVDYGISGNYPIGCFQAVGGEILDTYLWDLGNNSVSTEQNPTATYSRPGVYTAIFTASNDTTSLSDTVDITVYAKTDITDAVSITTHKTNKSFTLGLISDDETDEIDELDDNEVPNNDNYEQGV
jgi:hypothetical protein